MNTQKLNDLDQFRKNTVGHNYGLNPTKILFPQRSEQNFGEGNQTEVDKDREFFCSELVAKAFKVLDVVRNPEIKSSSCYVPGHFDFDNIVDKDLKDDVALGPCLNILANASMDLNKYENLHDIR